MKRMLVPSSSRSPLDEIQHLGLDGRVEARGRLVEDEEGRVGRQRHGDDCPLLHPSRELVRVAAHDPRGVRDLDA